MRKSITREVTRTKKEHKIESKWSEGYLLGFCRRTSEAIAGTKDGVIRAGTLRRVGAHRRWDAEVLDAVRGVRWTRDPDAEEVHDKLLVRMLSEDEKKQLERPAPETGPKTVYRIRLTRDYFIEKGFTNGCLGCKAILEGSGARGHTEACRRRTEEIMRNTSEGQDRLKRRQDRENEHLSRLSEPHDPYSHIHKRAKTDTRDDSEAGRQVNIDTDGTKHSNESDNKCDSNRRRPERDVGFERLTRKPDCGADGTDHRKMKLPDGERPNADIEGDQEMETNMAERMYLDDLKWNLDHVEDMCEDEATNLKQTMADYAHHDENT